jgi:hypothetical protein
MFLQLFLIRSNKQDPSYFFVEKLNQKMNVDPNSQQDGADRLKANTHGMRRSSVNIRKSTSQNLFGAKRNKTRGRSQSLAVETGTTLLPKNFKK